MTLRFSDHPGRRERRLQRLHGNPLFGNPPPQVSLTELEQARRDDLEEAKGFQEEFLALIQKATSLQPSEESEVILKLKERADQSYEQASGLAGDQAAVKAAIPQLVSAIMAAVRRGAADDPLALQELDQEEEARSMHYRLLQHTLVADLLAPDSPITEQELLPTLLCADQAALEAALQLFDADQLSALAEDGRALVAELQRDGRLPPAAQERLATIEDAASQGA